jgi:hypothetical protein
LSSKRFFQKYNRRFGTIVGKTRDIGGHFPIPLIGMSQGPPPPSATWRLRGGPRDILTPTAPSAQAWQFNCQMSSSTARVARCKLRKRAGLRLRAHALRSKRNDAHH